MTQNLQQGNQQYPQTVQQSNQPRKVLISMFPCPLGCQHSVPWGSLSGCENFKAMVQKMRKDTVDKLKTTKCCLKKGGKSHDPVECRSPLCTCGRAPPHNELICPAERIQMTNLQPSIQMIECDQQTAEQHMAMAEMMKEDDGTQVLEPTAMDQTNLMQFSTTSGATYGSMDQMYSCEINDFSYYLTLLIRTYLPLK